MKELIIITVAAIVGFIAGATIMLWVFKEEIMEDE